MIPHRLLTDLRDSPLAIGIYSLLARLYLITQCELPLSACDIQRYDPTLSRGAILRAIARLVQSGWIVEQSQTGHKHCYVPAWGPINGRIRAWQMQAPALGRPAHIHTLRLDQRLLDLYLGKLTPHPRCAALVERYLSQPLISLADVGAYALTLYGQTAVTPTLLRWGLIHGDQACAIPPDHLVLAYASQPQEGCMDSPQLTRKGLTKIGIAHAAPPAALTGADTPLFFVPPELIATVIGGGISNVIGHPRSSSPPSSPPECITTSPPVPAQTIAWSQKTIQRIDPPPTANGGESGGGNMSHVDSQPEIPPTETAQALMELHVRPRIVAELSNQPIEIVRAAIAAGQARPDVRDLAGWVVAMVRDVRDHHWDITRASNHISPDARDHAHWLAAAQEALTALERPDVHCSERHTEAWTTGDQMISQAGRERPVDDHAGAAPAQELTGMDGESLPDLTTLLRRELRARAPRDLWAMINALTVEGTGSATPVHIWCVAPDHVAVLQQRCLPMIHAALRAISGDGAVQIQLRVAPARRSAGAT
jgi:hypothetical protein